MKYLLVTALLIVSAPVFGQSIATDYYRCSKLDDHTIRCVPITAECLTLIPGGAAPERMTDDELKKASPRDPLCWPMTIGRIERRR